MFQRQRQLPFGQKLQNHALNSRLNDEFRRYFPHTNHQPILRDIQTNRYWFNEHSLVVNYAGYSYTLAASILKIIEAYIQAKRDALERFFAACEQLLAPDPPHQPQAFIHSLLTPLCPTAAQTASVDPAIVCRSGWGRGRFL